MALHNKTSEHLHVERLVQTKLPGSPIYAFLLTPVEITSASRGQFVARLRLGENHMNSQGSMHGSVIGTIVDWAGGMAIACYDGREQTGVSIDIHVTYQSSTKLGDQIEIEGVAEKVGGTMAFTRVRIYRVEGEARGRVVATGTHTKYVKGTEVKKS